MGYKNSGMEEEVREKNCLHSQNVRIYERFESSTMWTLSILAGIKCDTSGGILVSIYGG